MGATSGQPGWVAISKFLGWPEHRVRHSLERLGVIMAYALPNYPLQELKTISIRGVEGSLNNVESEHEGRNEQEKGEF